MDVGEYKGGVCVSSYIVEVARRFATLPSVAVVNYSCPTFPELNWGVRLVIQYNYFFLADDYYACPL